jgi:hypothetical protein
MKYKNKIVHLVNNYHSIGDMICSFPLIIAISREAKEVYVEIGTKHIENKIKMEKLFEFFPKKYNVKKYDSKLNYDKKIVIPPHHSLKSRPIFLGEDVEFFRIQNYLNDKIHMTQVNFQYANIKIPKKPIRPELQIPYIKTESYDYLLAPYAYSLNESEFLQDKVWQTLIDAFPDKKFGIFGQQKYDNKKLSGKNLIYIFDKSYAEVANIMRRSGPLISVVTGLSHLAFALGTPHIQLTNQSFWSINPNAIAIVESKPICFFPEKQLINLIKRIENGEQGIIIPKDFNYVQNEI